MSRQNGKQSKAEEGKETRPHVLLPTPLITTGCFSAFVLFTLKALQSSLLGTFVESWEAQSLLSVTLKNPRWYK